MRFLCQGAICILLLAGASHAGNPPRIIISGAKIEVSAAGERAARPDEKSYEILRLLPKEKRLVIRHKQKLSVLHEGDSLPESDIRVARFEKNQATLVRGAASGRPGNLILLSDVTGEIKIQILSDRSNAALPSNLPAPSAPPAQVITEEEKDR
jgi:hypothetical protein